MSEPVSELPPVGFYLAHDVGRLAGVSGRTIGLGTPRLHWLIAVARPRVYSYQDVAEAMIVHELLERNSTHREIRQTIHTQRQEFGRAWPLSAEPPLGRVRSRGSARSGLPTHEPGRQRRAAWP